MEIVVYLRSWKAAGIGLAAIAMASILGVLAFETDERWWNYFSAAILLFGLLFFSGFGLALLLRAISPYPAVRTGAAGIEFRSVPFMSGRIPYSNVSQVRAVRYGAAQYVSVGLRDEDSFIRSQRRLLRPALRYLSKAGHPVCVILVGVGHGEEHRAISERLWMAVQTTGERLHAA
jgi:hypothetical protein